MKTPQHPSISASQKHSRHSIRQLGVRDRILVTASDLFYRQGYNSTGINQIIDEADVAKASLYQHFPTKEDLCAEYLRRTSDEFFASLERYLSETQRQKQRRLPATKSTKNVRQTVNKPISGKESILKTFDFLRQFALDTGFRGCNFLNVLAEIPQDNEKLKWEVKRNKDMVRGHFHRLLHGGEYGLSADELHVILEGSLAESKVQQSVWPIEVATAMVKRLL
jgi:AcrR family transcriptional regulator